ncbi:hypothetical protein ACCC92_16805 [Mucilaginibacter sp. Mucisp84]|uniref:hypothetical protein n=1 Tax=Mucilaginibacter sp. Mucisp84 TaxID=3243058 RepID=UPI0039A5809E
MNEFSLNGGAYVGNTRASQPLATLKVTPNMLMVTIGFMGQLYFNVDDIISIEPTSGLNGSGIRIIHSVTAYPKKVLFTTGMGYQNVIENIKDTGFFDKTISDQVQYYQIKKMQEQGKLPIKTAALILLLAGWNIPPIAGLIKGGVYHAVSYSRLSLLFAFFSIILTLFSPAFRTLVLKEGREISDMKKSLYFLLLIITIGGIVFTFVSRVPFNK